MNHPVFLHLTSQQISEVIHSAKQRVLYCAPGLQQPVAAALVNARRNLGREHVRVVLDVNDATARMGYGEFDAVTLLMESTVDVRLEQGLRTCVLIADDVGYAFFTPPMLVEIQDDRHVGINAMSLMPEQIDCVVSAIVLQPVVESAKPDSTTEPVLAAVSVPLIGKEPLAVQTVEQVRKALDANPPQKFDLARKVNVFNSMVEFMELKLKGLKIAQHTARLPADLLPLFSDKETADRFIASFRLIDGDSVLTNDTKKIINQVKAVRDKYLRSIGSLGNVMLRSASDGFEGEVKCIQVEIENLQKDILERLEKEIKSSKEKLVESLLPNIRNNPPQELTCQRRASDLTDDVLRRYLDDKLQRAFPKAESLVSEMKLESQPKGVTYETLISPDFQRRVKDAFPYADWEKPFKEFEAVAGQEQHELF